MYDRQRLYYTEINMTLQNDILNLKRRIRQQRKLTKKYATLVSEISFKKHEPEDIIQIMRAIYKEIYNEKAHF